MQYVVDNCIVGKLVVIKFSELINFRICFAKDMSQASRINMSDIGRM